MVGTVWLCCLGPCPPHPLCGDCRAFWKIKVRYKIFLLSTFLCTRLWKGMQKSVQSQICANIGSLKVMNVPLMLEEVRQVDLVITSSFKLSRRVVKGYETIPWLINFHNLDFNFHYIWTWIFQRILNLVYQLNL